MEKEETLEDLENQYFMLCMQDVWTQNDYNLSNEIQRKIRKLKENEKND